jgi:SAM-dependent methyltransferase
MPALEEFLKEWNTYTLSIESDRGPLVVKWNDADTLAKWSNMQAGLYLKDRNSLQIFYENFTQWYQMFWNARFKQGLFDLPDDARILDIGSGIGVIDLLLAQYLPKSKFYLVDREDFGFSPGIYYDKNYPFYHSWQPLHDAIETTGLDENRFTTLDPDDQFPDEVDCVTSYLSWGWHYPKDIYWDQIMSCLKKGGRLIMDIRSLPDRDIINEISEDMKSQPDLYPFQIKLPAHIDNMPSPDPNKPVGYRATWVRK